MTTVGYWMTTDRYSITTVGYYNNRDQLFDDGGRLSDNGGWLSDNRATSSAPPQDLFSIFSPPAESDSPPAESDRVGMPRLFWVCGKGSLGILQSAVFDGGVTGIGYGGFTM